MSFLDKIDLKKMGKSLRSSFKRKKIGTGKMGFIFDIFNKRFWEFNLKELANLAKSEEYKDVESKKISDCSLMDRLVIIYKIYSISSDKFKRFIEKKEISELNHYLEFFKKILTSKKLTISSDDFPTIEIVEIPSSSPIEEIEVKDAPNLKTIFINKKVKLNIDSDSDLTVKVKANISLKPTKFNSLEIENLNIGSTKTIIPSGLEISDVDLRDKTISFLSDFNINLSNISGRATFKLNGNYTLSCSNSPRLNLTIEGGRLNSPTFSRIDLDTLSFRDVSGTLKIESDRVNISEMDSPRLELFIKSDDISLPKDYNVKKIVYSSKSASSDSTILVRAGGDAEKTVKIRGDFEGKTLKIDKDVEEVDIETLLFGDDSSIVGEGDKTKLILRGKGKSSSIPKSISDVDTFILRDFEVKPHSTKKAPSSKGSPTKKISPSKTKKVKTKTKAKRSTSDEVTKIIRSVSSPKGKTNDIIKKLEKLTEELKKAIEESEKNLEKEPMQRLEGWKEVNILNTRKINLSNVEGYLQLNIKKGITEIEDLNSPKLDLFLNCDERVVVSFPRVINVRKLTINADDFRLFEATINSNNPIDIMNSLLSLEKVKGNITITPYPYYIIKIGVIDSPDLDLTLKSSWLKGEDNSSFIKTKSLTLIPDGEKAFIENLSFDGTINLGKEGKEKEDKLILNLKKVSGKLDIVNNFSHTLVLNIEDSPKLELSYKGDYLVLQTPTNISIDSKSVIFYNLPFPEDTEIVIKKDCEEVIFVDCSEGNLKLKKEGEKFDMKNAIFIHGKGDCKNITINEQTYDCNGNQPSTGHSYPANYILKVISCFNVPRDLQEVKIEELPNLKLRVKANNNLLKSKSSEVSSGTIITPPNSNCIYYDKKEKSLSFNGCEVVYISGKLEGVTTLIFDSKTTVYLKDIELVTSNFFHINSISKLFLGNITLEPKKENKFNFVRVEINSIMCEKPEISICKNTVPILVTQSATNEDANKKTELTVKEVREIGANVIIKYPSIMLKQKESDNVFIATSRPIKNGKNYEVNVNGKKIVFEDYNKLKISVNGEEVEGAVLIINTNLKENNNNLSVVKENIGKICESLEED